MTDNILCQAILITIGIPFVLIIIGSVVGGIQQILTGIFGSIFGSGFTFIVVNYLFFPGVMLHEIAHATIAFLSGTKVTEVKLFEISCGTLGHVSFYPRGPKMIQGIQRVLVASAPVYMGMGYLYILYNLFISGPKSVGFRVFLGYLALSIIFHMTMSLSDIVGFVKGILWFMLATFCVVIIVLALLMVI